MNDPNGRRATVEPSGAVPPAAAAFAWAGALLFAASLVYFAYAYLVVFAGAGADGAWLGPALANSAMFSVFALHHSLFARTGLKNLVRRYAGPILERSIYTWVSSALFLLVCWAWQPVPGEVYRLHGAAWWVGVLAQVAGGVFTFVGSRALDVLDLAGVRAVRARPSGSAEPSLVTTGAFAVVRHPLYFGWLLFVFGAPHMTATRAVFAIVSTVYLALAIPWEERGLVRTFGTGYEDYRRQVRWKMLPGIY